MPIELIKLAGQFSILVLRALTFLVVRSEPGYQLKDGSADTTPLLIDMHNFMRAIDQFIKEA